MLVLNTIPLNPLQTVWSGIITPGVLGGPLIVMLLGKLVPQALLAVTDNPAVVNPLLGNVTNIELEVEAPPAPAGSVQLNVAPACGGQL